MNIKEKTARGMDLSGLLIIDSHAHMGFSKGNISFGDVSARGIAEIMKKTGISRSLNSHILSVGADYRIGNDIIYQAMKEYPGRILGMCGIDPNYPDEIIPELEKRFSHGFAGIKIHPYEHNYFADGENYRILYEYANKHRRFILSHTYRNNDFANQVCAPLLFDKLAKKYKTAAFILGHSGGAPWGHEDSIKLARKHDNIYLEMCSTEEFSSFWLKIFVDKVGDDRIFFGSDTPFHDPRPALGEVLFAKIPDKSKEKILGLNIRRLLREKGLS